VQQSAAPKKEAWVEIGKSLQFSGALIQRTPLIAGKFTGSL
jgi:hypothetical protein